MYDLVTFIFQNSFLLRGIILFILGIIIGSFLNVVIYRLPIMLRHKWHTECSVLLGQDAGVAEKINLVYPSSHCPKCKAKVPVWANIPIFGYFLLNGRCNSCKDTISIRYPLVELVTGLLFVISAYYSSDMHTLPALLVFISFIICLILIDYDTFILPDELTLSLMWLGILVNLNGRISGSLANSVLGAVVGYMLLWSVYWLFKLITKRDGMGYGDFKLLAAILAWTGYAGVIPITFIASALGIIYFVSLRIYIKISAHHSLPHPLSHEIPFGPFLGIAGVLFLFADRYFIPLTL